MRRWIGIAIVAAALSLGAPAARAQDGIEGAKAAGIVGERPDGTLGVVSGASADVAAMVERVNAERLQRYRDVARTNGVAVDQVQALAGKRLIENAPAGQYVQAPGRGWVRK
jgi:uncharacterized protein YdbL (DUF1318 family)